MAPTNCPNIMEWIQNRFIGMRGQFKTPMDIYYAHTSLSEDEKMLDKRWDGIIPRTMMFKRYFRMLKAAPTAVEMVEAMKQCGITKHIMQTLPEAISVPLYDAITLCQPTPPQTWSADLLDFVKRSDMSYILSSGKRKQPATSNLLVSSSHCKF